MSDMPSVILSGFADEAAFQKTAVQQFAAFAALGLSHFSIRFIDVGDGIKNAMLLTNDEVKKVRALQAEYGLKVSSLGSPIGKVKLVDEDDGTKNAYVPFKKYLAKDVKRACQLANAFETKLIRGFSFYHPKGTDPKPHVNQAVDQLGQIAEVCDAAGLTFGLEVEANLVGATGQTLAELYKKVNHPAMVLVFDAANIVMQGFSASDVYEQYTAMKPGLGWVHIKDYRQPHLSQKGGHVDEDKMKNFVPCDQGDGAHERILRDLKEYIPTMERKLRKRGVPGVFLDMEPHLKGGGQFGGFSGPDGMGVAVRALTKLLDFVGLGYQLRDYASLRA